MPKYRQIILMLVAALFALASVPANAQVQLQSRASNIPGGNIPCTGLDIDVPITFTGTQALPPGFAQTWITGASILVQTNPTSGVQHAFVGIDGNHIFNNAAGFNGNGHLVQLALGEIHQTYLFPWPGTGVSGYRLNTLSPTIHVTFSCAAGFFQGQIIFYFVQF